MSDVDPHKLEILKVWYSMFCSIMDAPENDAKDMALLLKLRQRLADESPEMEKEFLRRRGN